MTDHDSARRRYDSDVRTQAAARTRAGIADAARSLFLERGWAATTVRDVAREAGVSVPTVYAVYGGKVGLAAALADSADLSAGLEELAAQLEEAPGPLEQLRVLVAYDRRLFEDSGDLIRVAREAGRSEPLLAATYRDRRHQGDQARARVFASWPAGALRDGVTVEDAVDVYAALCNIDVYTTLVAERGWSPDRVSTWWTDALARELLA
ncbi:TetR/AcrR family transcriptional regulator [Microbacterium lushaniae]|nr:TetR/AcrR family transcriptional regulator [Microbacterium lushaniae]